MDRNCEICKHHSESGCSKWECQFEPTDSKHDVIEELEKIKTDIKDISKTLGFINHTTMVCDEDTKLFVSMEDIEKMFVKHIAELKGE